MRDYVSDLAASHLGPFVETLSTEMGVIHRHYCRDFIERYETARTGDSNSDLSARAVEGALANAGLTIDHVDLLIGHTTTPDTLLPPNVSWVADKLGYNGQYMELRQACTGFANALFIAGGLIAAGVIEVAAIVGSETGSVFFDMGEALRDRSQLVTAAQMGDAAGAVVVSKPRTDNCARIVHSYFGNNGCGKDTAFSLLTGSASQPFLLDDATLRGFHNAYGLARDSGLELFQIGFEHLCQRGYPPELIKFYLPHQANGMMATILSPVLGIGEEQFYNTAVHYGNTGSAATWIGLDRIRRERCLGGKEAIGVLGAEATKFLIGGFVYVEAG